jgi:hypothetical protein
MISWFLVRALVSKQEISNQRFREAGYSFRFDTPSIIGTRFYVVGYLVFYLGRNCLKYVMLRFHISETQLHNWLGFNAISSSTPIVSLSHFEALQFCELDQFIFAVYVPNLSSTRSDFQYHSIRLRIHTGSVYRDPAKFTSLSFSTSISSSFRSIIDNDPNSLLHREWVESYSLSFLDQSLTMIWTLSSIRVSAIHFCFCKWIFSFLDLLSTMIWRRFSIESVLNSLRSLQMNLCLFSGYMVDNDLNTVADRKWLELISLSTDGISLFSRFIVDNDPNNCPRPKVSEVHISFFLDQSSTMIGTLPSIEGEWSLLLFL